MKLEKLLGENAYVRNLFAVLSVLAVSGHFIDQCLSDSWVSKGLFLFVFSFHMPLLMFLAGTIFKNIEAERGKIFRLAFSSLGLYALMKLVISTVRFPFSGKFSFSLLTESGAPWIFFSIAVYLLLAYCLKCVDKRALLGLSLVLALLCGYTGVVGDFLVLSRTIVFSPFFIFGWMCGIDRAEQAASKKSFRLSGLCVLVLALFVMVFFVRQCYFLRPLFTGRNPYSQLGGEALYGPLYRLLTYGIGAILAASVLAVTPRRSFGSFFDNLGTSFVQIYFWHRPVLYVLTGLGVYDLLDQTLGWKLGRILWVVCALILVGILSAEIMKRVFFYGSRLLRNNAIRAGIFVLVGIGILGTVSTVMVSRAADTRTYQWYGGFYEEEKNTLDAVYIGSSGTYAYWLAPLAWERYGITVFPFTCNSQPFEVAEYMIKEARKTQPDALYIVPIRTIRGTSNTISDVAMHYLTDDMPLSWNKIQLVWKMGDYMDLDWADRLEYLFPIIRYHSRWNELDEIDFVNSLDGLKGGSHYSSFLRTSTDISSSFQTTERNGTLADMTHDTLESLLEYCDEEQLNVLFVWTPSAITDEYKLARINTIKETIQEHGYPVLDMLLSVDEIGIDLTKDYYNVGHTNIHGAIKITDYLSRYLVENYGFEDKRGSPAYSSWDEAYTKYTAEYASAYTLDVEWNGEPRDRTLAAPVLSKVAVNGTSLTVSWEAVPGADGYRVYRKTALGKSWTALDTVDGDTLSYTDSKRTAGSTYYYTVIAYREEGSVRYWGDYDFSGITGKATLNKPNLVSLEGSENHLTLTWETVRGAAGYAVFRKIPSKSWIEIADVGKATSFTDTEMLADMPYQYTVKAYYRNGEGSRVMSSYDTTGLLYAPDLELPMLDVVEEEGTVCLSWDQIEGIQGYTVYRRTEDSDWAQITIGNLSKDSIQFRDITAQAGVRYAYKLEAYIKVGEQGRVYTLEPEPEWIEIEKARYDTAMAEIIYLEQTWNQVYVAWEPTAGASSYRVYRRVLEEDGNWSEWKSVKSSVSGSTYLDTPAAAGTYQYLVQSLFTENDLTYYGIFDEGSGATVGFETKFE